MQRISGGRSNRQRLRWWPGSDVVLVAIGVMASVSFVRNVSAEGYQVSPVTDGGTISGTASWPGDIPAIDPIPVSADQDTCGEKVPSKVLRVDPNTKGVRSVLVYLENVDHGKAVAEKYWLHMGKDDSNKVPDTTVCQFREHICAFVRSQPVAMINFDEVLHNPHFFNEKHNSVFNVAMPTPNREVDHTILREHGVGLPFQCDIHAHMNGYAFRFDHPYFTVTDASGHFEITDVPPGTYTLVVWHESYTIDKVVAGRPRYGDPYVIRKTIEVKPKETVTEQIVFPVR